MNIQVTENIIVIETNGVFSSIGGGGAVDSVNGYTGDVTLVANDVGAYSKSESDNLLSDKVDKEAGKGLSTNDYSNADKVKVSKIITDGAGDKYLSDDGNYKTVSSGGGGMSMTVIDYDPTLPANQTVETIGIDQAFPVAGTCTISGNTVTVATTVSGRVCVGLPLSTDAEFEFDINIVGRGVFFLKDSDDYINVIASPKNVAYHMILKVSEVTITQGISAGNGTGQTYGKTTQEMPINTTLKFMTGEAMMFLETGLSTIQEVRDLLAGNGMSEQDINDTIAAYTSTNWLSYQASSRLESFAIPKEFNMIYFCAIGLNTGDTFTIGVTKNGNITYNVPSGLSDGTYLKALGNCTLLGKSMKTGDFLQLYNNGQDGILIGQ